jgi:hypothetical protein
LEGLVDGLNREVSVHVLTKTFESAHEMYRAAKAEVRLQLGASATGAEPAVRWLLRQLVAD